MSLRRKVARRLIRLMPRIRYRTVPTRGASQITPTQPTAALVSRLVRIAWTDAMTASSKVATATKSGQRLARNWRAGFNGIGDEREKLIGTLIQGQGRTGGKRDASSVYLINCKLVLHIFGRCGRDWRIVDGWRVSGEREGGLFPIGAFRQAVLSAFIHYFGGGIIIIARSSEGCPPCE